LGGLGALFGGLSPPPRGSGTEQNISSKHIYKGNLLNQQKLLSLTHQTFQSAPAEEWISSETLAQLRKISRPAKNEKSLNLNENLDVFSAVKLSLEDWRATTENRKDHTFTGDNYRGIF